MVALFLIGVAITAINQFWKGSAHAAAAAGSAATLVVVFGAWLVPSFLIVALVAWSRVKLHDHTPGQVVVGAVTGAALAPPIYLLMT